MQLKKQHARDTLVLSDPESAAAFADKFIIKSTFVVNYLQQLEVMEFKRNMKMEERARESREAKGKSYEDYPWAKLCEDVTKMKKLCVPELDHSLPQSSPFLLITWSAKRRAQVTATTGCHKISDIRWRMSSSYKHYCSCSKQIIYPQGSPEGRKDFASFTMEFEEAVKRSLISLKLDEF